jgi:polar amino acid transport system permease protein
VPRRPLSLELGMATYIAKKKLLQRKERFPFTLMLEPLELCNLACTGCGRIQEYKDVFHKRLTVEQCLSVAEECGAPIVNIPGGEPLIHKQIDEIVHGIIDQGRFVYLCTNGILMNKAFGRIEPTKRFAFVVHIDGMESVHDHAVDRQGVFKKATGHMREAIDRGYRVCTNTTIFRGTPELLIVLIFYFGSAVTLTWIATRLNPATKFVDIPPLWAGAFAISLIVGAYATETFRGALQGVDRGQVEAARALGLSPLRIFLHVRLPQMWRLALPGLGNHMNSIIKDTSLLSVIGVEEITYTAEMATTLTGQPFTMYLVVAVIYLAFTSLVVVSVARLERRANRHLSPAR